MILLRSLPALALLAAPAAAQDAPAFAPCLAARDGVDAYVAAFEAEGWTLATGAAREEALLGPAEMYYRASYFPPADTTPEEIEARLAEIRAWGQERLADAAVLTRGEAAALVRFDATDPPRVLCLVTAADLPETDTFLPRNAEPGPFGRLAMASYTPPEPPGLTDLRLDAMRHLPEVKPPEPRPGTEGVFVTFALEGEE